jgi:hypothetical protein
MHATIRRLAAMNGDKRHRSDRIAYKVGLQWGAGYRPVGQTS